MLHSDKSNQILNTVNFFLFQRMFVRLRILVCVMNAKPLSLTSRIKITLSGQSYDHESYYPNQNTQCSIDRHATEVTEIVIT